MAKQDGAVEVEEPLEKRSEALEEENPKVVAEILVKIRHPGRILLLNRSSNWLKIQGI